MGEGDETVSSVSLKLPTFWCQQPKVWFAQAEAQFAIRNITKEDTKYYYVIAALDQDTAVRVLDIIQTKPSENPFTTLKTRLLGTFDLSDYERAAALIHMPQLGDDKPSHLMDKMMGLLGDHKPDFIFRQLFLERLPEQVRAVLVHSGVTDCREMAKQADALFESQQQTTGQIGRISKKPSRGRSERDNKDQTNKSEPRLCFYHRRWGAKANRCVTPCTWVPGNSPTGPQPQ